MSDRQSLITIAEDAAKLLRSGRVTVALGNIERLPSLISAAMVEAYEAGVADGLPPFADPAVLQAEIEAKQDAVQRLDEEISSRRTELYRLGMEAHSLKAEIECLGTSAQRWRDTIARLERQEAMIAARILKLKAARPVALTVPTTRQLKPHQVLAEALASGRVTTDAVAMLLRVRPEDVAAIADGRVGLPRATWQQLLADIEL